MAKGQKTGGRKPGSLNKTTVAAKEAFQLAFEGIGGADAFATWAKENQTDFYKLYSKLIPVDVKADIDGRLVVEIVKFADHSPSK
jgi:hypothetical protein